MAKVKHLKSLGAKKTRYALNAVNPKVLETFDNTRRQKPDDLILVPFVMPNIEFTSLCPKTGQPDFARIEIVYIPNEKMVESKSLKLYLFSFRNHGAFHEECVRQIADDLYGLLNPYYLRVTGDFTPRGGIAIKPMVQRYDDYDSVACSLSPNDKANIDAYKKNIFELVHQFDAKKLGL